MRIAALFLAGWLFLGPAAFNLSAKTIYTCPMHPSYRSDHPGKCPICGMDLVPVKEATAQPHRPAPSSRGLGLVPVQISPERQQLIGVRTAPVVHRQVVLELRAPARVTYDETRIYEVHTRVSGWVERVYVDQEGIWVKKGAPLFTLYSPEVLSTEEEFLRSLTWARNLKPQGASGALALARRTARAAEERLLLWGLSRQTLQQIRSTGKPVRAFPVPSPVSGFVVEKRIFPGKRITPASVLYRLADLSRVWIEADFYETEAPLLRVGLPVEVLVPGTEHKFQARIEEIYPWVEEKLRVFRVRLSLANPRMALRPGAWAEVRVRVPLGMRMVIPDEALIYGGRHYYVFVRKGPGTFEPRMVKVGRRVGHQRIVLSGLHPGEEVVVSANFLIDAESRLKAALKSFGGSQGDHAHH